MSDPNIPDTFDLRHAFRLTEPSAKLLQLLLRDKTVPAELIEKELGVQRQVVAACVYRLRRRMEVLSVSIELMWGAGYYLSSGEKSRVRELVAEATQVTA